jgi:hypothetical protein
MIHRLYECMERRILYLDQALPPMDEQPVAGQLEPLVFVQEKCPSIGRLIIPFPVTTSDVRRTARRATTKRSHRPIIIQLGVLLIKMHPALHSTMCEKGLACQTGDI